MKPWLKNSVLSMAAIAAAFPSFSQAKISGKLLPNQETSLKFTQPGMETLEVPVDKAGNFSFATGKLPKGIYQLEEIGQVYLEPGYTLEIIPEGDDYRFKGKGSMENNLIREAGNQLKDYVPMSKGDYLYSFYMLSLPEFRQKMNAWQQAAAKTMEKSGNPYFIGLQNAAVNFRIKNITQDWWINYGVDSVKRIAFQKLLEIPPNPKDTMSHVKFRKAFDEMHLKKLTKEEKKELDSMMYDGWDMNNEEWFRNVASYRDVLDGKITNIMYAEYQKELMAGKEMAVLKARVVDTKITSPFIREYYQYVQASSVIKMSDDVREIDTIYKKFIAQSNNDVYKKNVSDIYKNFKKYGDNQPAPDFEFENNHGAKVKLSSLKGKYVYIDVWATWCGPCKREIPFLTSIEEKFAGKNIHFISLSVDRQSDKGKWLDFVKEKQLKGEQLITDDDFNSDFIKNFNINAIPRFILIGPDGKIVSARAKRPSDPKLQEQLSSLL
ncbi:TlpA family protein disulfide reductase [Chitinophaga sp. G-6-1-13]|uniref:TlpA family protein disulfide reductase n=1 Tax=Chitinophaga fulva TaxID=2728842 RepID=A0A848GRX2_9BACT|nr:TlpA disulfide reductase family protein [Chitinophaga fulva]NML41144.1 TlpA family protein disulfide reductase [Chitinophaga fulva]